MREIRFIDDSNPKLLKKALDLMRDVFWEFEAAEFTDEGVMDFSNYIEYETIVQKIQEGALVMLGCFEERRLAGVLALESPGHIRLLFVAKQHQRKGIARALVEEIIGCVRGVRAFTTFTVNSSPHAVPIYQKLGFVATHKEQILNEVCFTPMQYDG